MVTVSVVTPTRNRPDMLRQAYESLRDQTFQDYEFIISVNGVDARSLPEARRIEADDPRARVLYHADFGLSQAWNAGFEASKGEIVHFLADDDLLEPAFLERGVEALRMRPEVDLVGTDLVAFSADRPRIPLPCMLENPGAAEAREGTPAMGAFILNVTLFRRRLLERVTTGSGPFDPSFRTIGDEDLFVRILKSGAKAYHMDSPLVRYRIHPGQVSQSMKPRHFFEHLRVSKSIRRLSAKDVVSQAVWAANRGAGFFGTRVMVKLGRRSTYRLNAMERLMFPELGP